MNSRGRWSILFGLAAAGSWLGSAAGCSDPGVAPDCTPPSAAPPVTPRDLFVDDDSHWIVKDPSGVCQSISKWTGARLFGRGSKMGGIMATYCAYAWTGDGTPDLTLLMGLEKARDRRGLMPQTPATVESWAHDTFLQGIALPTQAPGAGKRVRVIVADTERFGAVTGGVVGKNLHGALMAALVHDVACPATGPCSVQVQRELALPRRRNPTTHLEEQIDNRGDFGRLSDLVVAIDNSLTRWRADVAGGGQFPPMLALSLSLAFEKPASVPSDEDFSADDVVLDALKTFSCHGGAIFAAAGNHGGKDSTGLLYPAFWQNDPAPDEAACKALITGPTNGGYAALEMAYSAATDGQALLRRDYYPDGGSKVASSYLLHAIGAFDQGGVPIKKTRENACPRYGALGLGWSVWKMTDLLLTGTSVPTAVVSAFFATAMAQDSFTGLQQSFPSPYLHAHPQTILDEIAKLSPTRPFEANGPCGKAWTCSSIPWIGGSTAAAASAQHDEVGFPRANYRLPFVVDGGQAQDNNCTEEPRCERPGASPVAELFPQPTEIPCTRGCFVDLHQVTFLINPAMKLTDVKLTIDTGVAHIVDITAAGQSLDAGTLYEFKLDPALASALGGARLSVSALTAANTTSVSEQVLVVQ